MCAIRMCNGTLLKQARRGCMIMAEWISAKLTSFTQPDQLYAHIQNLMETHLHDVLQELLTDEKMRHIRRAGKLEALPKGSDLGRQRPPALPAHHHRPGFRPRSR